MRAFYYLRIYLLPAVLTMNIIASNVCRIAATNRSDTGLVKPPDSQGPAKWSPSPDKGSTGSKLFKQDGHTDFTGWPWQQGQTGNQPEMKP